MRPALPLARVGIEVEDVHALDFRDFVTESLGHALVGPKNGSVHRADRTVRQRQIPQQVALVPLILWRIRHRFRRMGYYGDQGGWISTPGDGYTLDLPDDGSAKVIDERSDDR